MSNGNGTTGQKLYVGNIPYTMDDARLGEIFAEFGIKVSNARVIMERETGRSKGFGFVEAGSPEAVAQAIQQMDGARVDGRILRVAVANERTPAPKGSGFPQRR
jgi:nucleolin